MVAVEGGSTVGAGEPASMGEETSLFDRIEDFAIEHIRAISVGVSTAIAILAAAMALDGRGDGPPPAAPEARPVMTGAIAADPATVPGGGWAAVSRPQEIIALAAPQVARSRAIYAARRSAAGEREDSLTFEPAGPEGLDAHVALLRGTTGRDGASLIVEITRRQTERGLSVERAARPTPLVAKFGEIEAADMTFADAGGMKRACLGFRSTGRDEGPRLIGWYCANGGQAATRPELACFLDRLTLLRAGEDLALRRFFAEAEKRRLDCPGGRNLAGRRPTWLDPDGRSPPMRGAEETTGSIARRGR